MYFECAFEEENKTDLVLTSRVGGWRVQAHVTTLLHMVIMLFLPLLDCDGL